jgi:hypothetical protein
MPNGLQDKVITITLNGSGVPVPSEETAQVKKDNQKVRFCADFDFRITIDGYKDVSYGTGGSSGCAFRAVTGTFGDVKQYKYTIHANGQDNDPFLDIKP